MKTVLHRAETRGHAYHGWLDSHHTFSFASYYDPTRMHFGVLRVLNDDIVQGGMGFGTHPHDNMEIISIPLKGDLEHKDSMGNLHVIKENDVQVMSAGTGIYHSEYNRNKDKLTNFLQIWVFPNKRDVTPRYQQKEFLPADRKNRFQAIIAPNETDGSLWMHQDAWFYRGDIEKGNTISYKINKEGNGLYIFVLEGEVKVNGEILKKRDGYGIWDFSGTEFAAISDTKLLLMEVPMELN